MEKKTIMLACAAGMSTSLLVKKMLEAAKNQGIDADIFAVSATEVDDNISKKPIDVVMLGPQVRFLKEDRTKKLEPKGIPVAVIDMADYGMMKGDKVLATALAMLG
ncbi:PTS sugar transporter subunit IIB [Carnobacterium maltaromaticum]|uniref:PTS sugar transporter subunit IIB n=1 Tax=Carnobacterium maltaromaticum TaxID=2751 RepID=UPI000C788FCB|nr:PTS sugar transporter subunit IIB [Carnobacterium maltaromaticum]PLS35289.1 PTS sugar transporter subunit IIB [Carnobacterium maltaromaticum]PLS35702.1 PTS sugar transporter subunit IIB [Carnobacterium maltaromaticum]PLS36152.1 PTS sugar transporter subunit IIB [Carnobacterium maltaromaticum]PLS42609.1 PTS sugar transporter subunit IIB [Carnobacterium maltaromaticum]PLS45630.1 PTS sugar transporter subunit IIB [Carnobacterium maltaromaticum]